MPRLIEVQFAGYSARLRPHLEGRAGGRSGRGGQRKRPCWVGPFNQTTGGRASLLLAERHVDGAS
jgi:hypothetical protein